MILHCWGIFSLFEVRLQLIVNACAASSCTIAGLCITRLSIIIGLTIICLILIWIRLLLVVPLIVRSIIVIIVVIITLIILFIIIVIVLVLVLVLLVTRIVVWAAISVILVVVLVIVYWVGIWFGLLNLLWLFNWRAKIILSWFEGWFFFLIASERVQLRLLLLLLFLFLWRGHCKVEWVWLDSLRSGSGTAHTSQKIIIWLFHWFGLRLHVLKSREERIWFFNLGWLCGRSKITKSWKAALWWSNLRRSSLRLLSLRDALCQGLFS